MYNVLSSTDKDFMNKLITNPSGEYVFNEDINTLILSNTDNNYNNKTTLYKNIQLLLDKFNLIYKKNIMSLSDTYICRRIADFILGKFTFSRSIIDFPSNLFNNDFIDFLIQEKLFFTEYQHGTTLNTLFNIILGLPDNYFNIEYNPAHKDYYISHAIKLKQFLNYQLMTYIILNKYELSLTLNFLTLMSESFNNVNPDDELYKIVFEIYEEFYNGLSNMISINVESLEFYNIIYTNKPNEDITAAIIEYKNFLYELSKLNILRKNLFNNVTNFNINNFKENDIHTITHLSNPETYIGTDYDNFKKIFTPVLLNVLKSTKTNIHQKTLVVLSINANSVNFICEYIKLFINIEKYNAASGYRFKIKIKTKIINMIHTFLINNPSELLEQYIDNTFVTLYTSHINNINTIIDELIKEIQQNPFGNSKMILMKYLIYLDHSVHFNKFFYKLFETDKQSIYYFKIIEQYYTLFKSLITNKLYTQLSILQEDNFLRLVELGSWGIVDSIFSHLYNNLTIMTQNDIFIDTWANNKFFYNKDIIDKTCKEYGSFNIKDGYSITDLLTHLSENIETKIQLISDSADKYDTEIPDKFKDPIMLIPIKQPIEIPSVKTILDKYTIYNHLIFNETNPFTNEGLTVNDLELYNNNSDVKERITVFLRNFNEWKTLHKI